jgi:hypothetical protein
MRERSLSSRSHVRQTMLALLIIGWLGGCSSMPQAEPQADKPARTKVKMTVVYAKRDRIKEVARDRGFQPQANVFYDRELAELWCLDEETREAFSACGRELRHVVTGDSTGEKLSRSGVLAKVQ